MKKIALVGEATHDTNAIQVLLEKYFEEKHHYFPLINHIRGSELDTQKTLRRLRIEFEEEKPDIVIFIRDVDGTEMGLDFEQKKQKRKAYFSKSKGVVDKKALFLLNIYALEALILADIESFNKYYKKAIAFTGNPMEQAKPEAFLKQQSNYKESDASNIFALLDVHTVSKNCRYFKQFLTTLSKRIR